MKIQSDIEHTQHINFAIDEHEYEKKLNLEQKEIDTAKDFLFNPNIEFDET